MVEGMEMVVMVIVGMELECHRELDYDFTIARQKHGLSRTDSTRKFLAITSR